MHDRRPLLGTSNAVTFERKVVRARQGQMLRRQESLALGSRVGARTEELAEEVVEPAGLGFIVLVHEHRLFVPTLRTGHVVAGPRGVLPTAKALHSHFGVELHTPYVHVPYRKAWFGKWSLDAKFTASAGVSNS